MDATLRNCNNRELFEMLAFCADAVREAEAELAAVRKEIERRAGV